MNSEFIRAYQQFRGWPHDASVHVYVDDELTPLYPIALYRLGDSLVIGITKMIEASKPALKSIDPTATVDSIIDLLFTGVKHKPDKSGFYILPQGHIVSPPENREGMLITPLTRKHNRDMKGLLAACSRRDCELGQVSIQDPCATGCFYNGELVSVASFWLFGDKIADIGVLTHPKYRKMGFGEAVVRALLSDNTNNGKWPLYRCDDWNTNSIALCASIGFERLFSVEGAVVTYPDN